jgi:hypothetical protein
MKAFCSHPVTRCPESQMDTSLFVGGLSIRDWVSSFIAAPLSAVLGSFLRIMATCCYGNPTRLRSPLSVRYSYWCPTPRAAMPPYWEEPAEMSLRHMHLEAKLHRRMTVWVLNVIDNVVDNVVDNVIDSTFGDAGMRELRRTS